MHTRNSIATFVAAALLGACGDNVSIHELNQNPQAYESRKISTSGTVGSSSGLLGLGAYVLQGDGQERLIVVTDKGLPPTGSWATVNGVFKQVAALNQNSYAVVLENEKVNFEFAAKLAGLVAKSLM